MTAQDAASKGRLYWQCRRGMRELDDLLMGFLDSAYASLDARECASFEKLLSCNDNLLLEYLMGRTVPRDPDTADIVQKIRTSAKVL